MSAARAFAVRVPYGRDFFCGRKCLLQIKERQTPPQFEIFLQKGFSPMGFLGYSVIPLDYLASYHSINQDREPLSRYFQEKNNHVLSG
jgi:hypothetical protein